MLARGLAILSLILISPGAAQAQGFYLGDWWGGHSGLFSRDYITPTETMPGYLTGGGRGGRFRGAQMIFAAASVDARCQQDGTPDIRIASRDPRIAIDIGPFIATGADGGSNLCVGRMVRGARLFYLGSGRAPIAIRVAYPNNGPVYDHVVPAVR